ncbi:MAG TPA: tetratricopeptide repeat protein [Verrucomicrobiae bacterium]|nr:tetratricopeptide repeat protein [Verrucomicrobiae bacterium]
MRRNFIWTFCAVACAGLVLGLAGCTKAAKRKRYLARANQDFASERYDRAELEYRAVLTIPPPDLDAVKGLGLVYLIEGKPQQAYVLFRRGLALRPADPQLQARLGETCLGLRQFREARDLALELLKTRPGDTNGWLLLAQASVSTNEAQQAQQRLAALPDSARTTSVFHLASGIAWLNQLQLDRGETELKDAIARDSHCCMAYSLLGAVYLSRKDLTNADQSFQLAAQCAPLRSFERLRYADWQLQSGHKDAGTAMAEEITAKAPDYVPAWVFLAQMAFAQHQFQTCSNLLRTALGRDPINLEGLLLNGNLLLAQGQASNAVTHFERVLQVYPKLPAALYGLARAQVGSSQPRQAVTTLNQALVIEPGFTEAALFLASIYLQQDDPNSAIALLRRLTTQQPQVAEGHLLLAQAYLVNKAADDALAEYRQMAKLFPRSPQVPLLTGGLLAQQGQKAAARQEFEKSLELAPDYLPAVEQLVNLDLAEKQYDQATQRVQARIDQQPRVADLWLLMARIHLARANVNSTARTGGNSAGGGEQMAGGQSAQREAEATPKFQLGNTPQAKAETTLAEQALAKTIELNPESRTAYLLLAQVYVASKEYQTALERLQSYVAETNDLVAWMQIGVIHEQLKDYSAARDDYERILKGNPQTGAALNNLAYLYAERLQQVDRAYELAAKARQLQPSDPAIADTLGWILYRRGDYSQALSLLQESAARLGDSPEVQCHLGMTCYMLGDEVGARTALLRALQANEDFPEKSDAEKWLAVLNMDVDTADAASLARMEHTLGASPQGPVGFERLGQIQTKRAEFDEAYKTCQAGLRSYPQNKALLTGLAGLCFEHRNDTAQALTLAKQAHDLAPDDPGIARLLGLVICHGPEGQVDYKWAASLLEDADRKLPFDPRASYDLAWAYYYLGRTEDAQRTMRLVTQSTGAFAQRADAERFLQMVSLWGNLTGAEARATRVQEVLRAEPGYLPALMVSARLAELSQDFEEAARSYRAALVRHPSFAPAMRGLVLVCAEHLPNEDASVFEIAKNARESYPDDLVLARAVGVLCYRRGEYRRALEVLQPCAGQGGGDAEALFYIGMAHYQLKDTGKSKAELRQALSLKLGAELAAQANGALAKMD